MESVVTPEGLAIALSGAIGAFIATAVLSGVIESVKAQFLEREDQPSEDLA